MKKKSKIDFERRPVWAEVSLGALKYNLNAIRAHVNPAGEKRATPRRVLCIVKGNGYGHGGPQVAKALEKFGADWFGVTCTEEGIAVRKAGVHAPILILTSFVSGEEPHLLKHNLTPVVHRIEQLADLNRAAARYAKKKSAAFHLKIDTGMNRLGTRAAPDEIAGGQFLDLHAVKSLGIEFPVEPLQGLAVRKASFSDPPRDGAFLVRIGLRPQQQIEEVEMREALFLRLG
jgi:alanine racemase